MPTNFIRKKAFSKLRTDLSDPDHPISHEIAGKNLAVLLNFLDDCDHLKPQHLIPFRAAFNFLVFYFRADPIFNDTLMGLVELFPSLGKDERNEFLTQINHHVDILNRDLKSASAHYFFSTTDDKSVMSYDSHRLGISNAIEAFDLVDIENKKTHIGRKLNQYELDSRGVPRSISKSLSWMLTGSSDMDVQTAHYAKMIPLMIRLALAFHNIEADKPITIPCHNVQVPMEMIHALIPWLPKLKAVLNGPKDTPAWKKLVLTADPKNPGKMIESGVHSLPRFIRRLEFSAYSFYVRVASLIYHGYLKPEDELYRVIFNHYIIKDDFPGEFKRICEEVFEEERKYEVKTKAEVQAANTAIAAGLMPGSTRNADGNVGVSPETLLQLKKNLLDDLAEIMTGIIRNETKSAVHEALSNIMGQESIDKLISLQQRIDALDLPASSSSTSGIVARPPPVAAAAESTALEAAAPPVSQLVLANMEVGKGRYRVEYHQPFGNIPKQLKGNKVFQHNIPSVTLPELGDFTSCLQVHELVYHPDCPLSLLNTRHKQYWTRVIPKGQKGSDVLGTRYRNLQRCLVAILKRKSVLGGTVEEACADLDNDPLFRNKDNSVSLSKIAATAQGSTLPTLGMEKTFKNYKKPGKKVKGKEVAGQVVAAVGGQVDAVNIENAEAGSEEDEGGDGEDNR
ncbi:hypothetical protein BDR26DRAFT_856773 [Obelidium mucronatum]|nr:hypothetical protein BDR26DRAFT_856773 [Obelidium mucronatum]